MELIESIKSKREFIIKYFLNRDILIPSEFLDFLKDDKITEQIYKIINESKDDKIDLNFLSTQLLSISSEEFKNDQDEEVIIKFSYDDEPQKKKIGDFISYFRQRFKTFELMLRGRPELQNITSINRILNKKERENIAIIGLVSDKQTTKNNNLMITLEDLTGSIKIIINKTKKEIFEQAKNIVLDEVLGIIGVNGDKIIFVDNIIFPDIPLTKELKKAPKESYILFLSDIHIGSKYFLKENFEKFLKWLSGEVGNEQQKEIAKKVTHIFIAGDPIDGVGIYPGQEKELVFPDIYDQYKECAKYLSKIPKNIKIIISPGNHDALRIAEPQPPLCKDFAKALYDLPNITFVSNPAMVNIGKTEHFEGFDILLYHGSSFDYYVANVESIRNNGGYDRGDLIMKFLLQKRHLAPTYSSTRIIPTPDKDNLIISKVPDIFVTGHIHKCSIPSQKNVNYRNITLVSGSCWQSTTPFQEKVGHNPEPARVPLINLQTREVKILNFEKI